MAAATAAAFLADAGQIAGVTLPYVSQASALLRARDPSGFDLRTSLVLIVASVLRIFYYVALPKQDRFATALLIQAGAAIATQLVMI
jgi:solute carrier family 66, member 2